jgi:starvation-inducible DNA-binding protein
MKPVIGISDTSRAGAADILNALVADESILCTKTKNFHWNVTGPFFSVYHAFFGEQYQELDEFIDEIAERVRILGFRAIGSFSEFINKGRLSEESTINLDGRTMILKLLRDHESIIRQLRHDIKMIEEMDSLDHGTVDFLTSIMQKHEKMAWVLRSHVEETH